MESGEVVCSLAVARTNERQRGSTTRWTTTTWHRMIGCVPTSRSRSRCGWAVRTSRTSAGSICERGGAGGVAGGDESMSVSVSVSAAGNIIPRPSNVRMRRGHARGGRRPAAASCQHALVAATAARTSGGGRHTPHARRQLESEDSKKQKGILLQYLRRGLFKLIPETATGRARGGSERGGVGWKHAPR